jgi:hypothetical protein
MTGVVWPRLADGLPPLQAPCLMRSSESAILGTHPMGLVVEVSPVGIKSLLESPRIVLTWTLHRVWVVLKWVPFQLSHVGDAISTLEKIRWTKVRSPGTQRLPPKHEMASTTHTLPPSRWVPRVPSRWRPLIHIYSTRRLTASVAELLMDSPERAAKETSEVKVA